MNVKQDGRLKNHSCILDRHRDVILPWGSSVLQRACIGTCVSENIHHRFLMFSIAQQTLTWHLKPSTVKVRISIMQTLMRKIMSQTVKRDPHREENYNSVSQVWAERAVAFHYITALTSPQERHLKYELTPVVFSLFSQQQWCLSYKRFNSLLSLAIFSLNVTMRQVARQREKINESQNLNKSFGVT